MEENLRRALTLSQGDLLVFLREPISATFLLVCGVLLCLQAFFSVRKLRLRRVPLHATR
jgi:TctA family transporter